MRWVRPFALGLLIAGTVMLPARAQVTSDTYDPSWPQEIHCPPAIGDQPLVRVLAITDDDAARTSSDVGDRLVACYYDESGPRISVYWATIDNPGDEAQWCGNPPLEEDNGRLFMNSTTNRVNLSAEFVDTVRSDIDRMMRAAETMALPCGGTTTMLPSDVCSPEGVVTSADGAVVAGVRVELHGSGDDELDATGTDATGRYEFAPPAASDTFAPSRDDVTVKVLLRDDGGVWDLWNGNAPAFMQSKPFKVATKTCRRDIVLGQVEAASRANPSTSAQWPPIERTLRRLQMVARFTADPKDGLGFTMNDRLPVTVYADCTGVGMPVGCPSAAQTAAAPPVGEGAPFYNSTPAPHIVMGPLETAGEGLAGCDSDTIPHEWGHALTADLFNLSFPNAPGSTNHAGYYGNAQSTDSWTEGFATYLGLEARKHAGGRTTPAFVWCQPTVSNLDFENDRAAWGANGTDEEWSIAGALLDVEDGPADYRPALVPNVIDRAARVVAITGRQGRVVVGKVRQGAAAGVKVRVELLGAGDTVAASGEAAIDADGWFYFPIVPANVAFASVRAYATQAGGREGDDDPIDATPKQVWDAIASFDTLDTHAGRPIETVGVFDAADLYGALHDAFPGDRDKDGVGDIDQVFRAHGLFVDANGSRTYQDGAPIGPTSHPAPGAPAGSPPVERNDVVMPPATWVKVDTGGVDATIVVSITFPPPDDDRGYSYIATPAPDGRVRVAMPPEDGNGVVTLTAVAPGRLPEFVTTIEPKSFWKDAATQDGEPFLDLSTTLRAGDLGGDDGRSGPPLAAGIGAAAVGFALAITGRRKRFVLLSAIALIAAGLGVGAWSLASSGSDGPGTELALAPDPSLPVASDDASTTSAAASGTTASSTTASTATSTSAAPAGDAELAPDGFSSTAALADDTTSDGTVISYGAEQVGDHDGSTAWCAADDASGEFITLSFGSPVTITSVGIEPGYDKVDAASGRDRWDENRHVTAVTYVFEDNTRVSATLDGTRAVQQHRLDAPITSTYVNVVIDSTEGIGDTCISEAAVLGRA